jgi:ferric-dicitrate binding protein FerR (iron transport regulator)
MMWASRRAIIGGACLALLWWAAPARAATGLDGRWYPSYRRDVVRWVQQVLKAANVYAGPVNGKLDGPTMEGLQQFQVKAGLHRSGVPTPLTRRALREAAPSLKGPAEPAFRGAATVVGHIGEVRITHVSPPRRVPQEFQHRVNVEDVIETGPDGKALLQLDDGSTLILGNSSRLVVRDLVSAPAEHERQVLVRAARGVLRFVARVVGDATTDIRVEAPTAVAGVRGTDWMMRIGPDSTAVFVETGSVTVMSAGPDRKEVVVPEQQGTDVAAEKPPTAPAPWGAQRKRDLFEAVEYP